ncbi:MAG TPA: hypothetical protein VLG76_01465 [Rhabdochlamydiaceae bacterium]|nr:hypothetical protein [Rhabdochlamydiaceae bacterium]
MSTSAGSNGQMTVSCTHGDAPKKQDHVQQHLGDLNALFLQAYGVRKASIKKTLGTASPVLLLHGDNLILKHEGMTKMVNYVPDHYHQIKNIAHIACTIHTVQCLQETQAGSNVESMKADCVSKLRVILELLKTDDVSPALKKYESLLQKYLTLLEAKEPLLPPLLSLKEDLKTLIKEAAIIRTDALHEQVKIIQKQMCPEKWNHLAIVVLGPRMPREGELSMQYSQAMILKPQEPLANLCPHLNGTLTKTSYAFQGKRLIYVESIDNIDKALDELTTEIADERLGEDLLGDKGALRADLLKDAVHDYLSTLK